MKGGAEGTRLPWAAEHAGALAGLVGAGVLAGTTGAGFAGPAVVKWRLLVQPAQIKAARATTVRARAIFGAHHLGWDGTDAWRELGYSLPPAVSMNDAEASALGEWLLRQDCTEPPASLLFAVIGTGAGGCLISGGEIVPVELGHQPGFGEAICRGCGRKGRLDAQIGGHALPARLTWQDRLAVAGKLGTAITRTGVPADTLVVFGGGLVRSYPDLVAALRDQLAGIYPVESTAAPPEAKSAAYVALFDRLVTAWRDNAAGGSEHAHPDSR